MAGYPVRIASNNSRTVTVIGNGCVASLMAHNAKVAAEQAFKKANEVALIDEDEKK